jgi:hypothetical protein
VYDSEVEDGDEAEDELSQPLPDLQGHLATFVSSALYRVTRLQLTHTTPPHSVT